MNAPVLIKVKEHHLVNPNQIICIDLEGKTIFFAGSRYAEVSDEDLQRILEYFTILGEDRIIPEIHPS